MSFYKDAVTQKGLIVALSVRHTFYVLQSSVKTLTFEL